MNGVKKLCPILFYMAFGLLVFETFFGNVDIFSNYKSIISICELGLIILCIIMQSTKYNTKSLFAIILCLCICFVSFTYTKNSNILFIFLFIIAAKNIDFSKFCKFSYKYKIILLCLLFIFLLTGIMENNVVYRVDGTVRNTFGFSSPNTLGLIISSICFEYIYTIKEKVSIKHSIALFVIAFLILNLCDSRASSYSLILFGILMIVFKKKIYFKKIIPYVVPIFLIVCFILIILYGQGNSLAMRIDDFVSTRLKCGYNYYINYGVSLLGNHIVDSDEWLGYASTIDNAYLDLIIRHGLIITILMVVYSTKVLKRLCMTDNLIPILVFLALFIYGLMEKAPFVIVYNIFWLCETSVIYSTKSGKNIINSTIQST